METMSDREDIIDNKNESDSSDVALSEMDDHNNAATEAEKKEEMKKLAMAESRAVAWLRVVVFLLLLTTAALVSVGVYLYTANDQEEDMEHEFAAHASKIIESFQDSVERKLEAVDALSVSITSFALATGATFPNVTLPHFEIRGANTRILADGAVINYSPLVTDDTRKGWEAFALEHQQMMFDDALTVDTAMRAQQDEDFGMSPEQRRLQDFNRFRLEIEDMAPDGSTFVAPSGSGPYLPVWQMTPMVPMRSVLNFNVLSHPSAAGAYNTVLNTGQAVMDMAANLNEEHLGDTGAYFQLLLTMGQYRHVMAEFTGDPSTGLGYPVFDSFGPNRTVAGLLATNLYWGVYFKNVLPPNAHGIICVLSNTLNQTFSYQVDGTTAKYLGSGDYHDSKYDNFEVSEDVTAFIQQRASPETRSYTSVDLNSDYIAYTLRVYPSQATEDDYINNEPILFTMVVALIFIFTSMVFIIYDCVVSRRQRIVMERALASGAIVASLFPSKVRDELYKENDEKKKSVDGSGITKPLSQSNAVSNFLSDGTGGELVKNSKPIANLYENCSVLFADLAGFTAWSSKRQPEEVFQLLETMYGAFDTIAGKRGVYKIETVGDCYVAVTGLPEAQEQHAVIISRFARDCMTKMSLLKDELVETLGEDTANLELRVGIHSGPVTGGILRGHKARFQLYGDTVNTAARMESNGSPGRIHVSQATADELISKGKSTWLNQREDVIVAKGKGEMQTYWVEIKSANSTAPSTLSVLSSTDSSST